MKLKSLSWRGIHVNKVKLSKRYDKFITRFSNQSQRYKVNAKKCKALYACSGEHSVILCHVLGKCTPFEDQSYGVMTIYGTVHVATHTFVEFQVRALCNIRRTSCMETQHVHRVVIYRGYVQHGYMQQYRENTQRVHKAR